MTEQRIVTPMTELVIVEELHRGTRWFHWTFFVKGRWHCEGYSATRSACHGDCSNHLCPI